MKSEYPEPFLKYKWSQYFGYILDLMNMLQYTHIDILHYISTNTYTAK